MAKIPRKPFPLDFEYNGVTFKLGVNASYSTDEFTAKYGKVKQPIITKDENGNDVVEPDFSIAAREICFLLTEWDLEDDEGIVPLVPEIISAKIPFYLLVSLTNTVAEFIQSGGLLKKS